MQSRGKKAIRKIASTPYKSLIRPFSSDRVGVLDNGQIDGQNPNAPNVKTFHPRRNNRSPLPISTYFDPARIAQRHQHRHPKLDPLPVESLDKFRQRIANNPFARSLASPIRRDELSRARIPSSFLLKFNPVRDPYNQIPGYTPIPVDLYSRVNPTWWHSDDDEAQNRKLYLYRAAHLPLRAPVYQGQSSSPQKGNEAAPILDPEKAHSNLPPGTGRTVSLLLRQRVMSAMAWPIKNAKREIQPLGLEYDKKGVPLDLHNVPGVVALMYFGGQVRSKQLAELEKRAIVIQQALARLLSRKGKLERAFMDIGIERLVKMNPRVTAPVLELSTVPYQFKKESQNEKQDMWIPEEYRIPVFNMVDILGEEKALKLLDIGNHRDVKWICIKEGRLCANPLQILQQAAWWFQEADFLDETEDSSL